MATRAAAATRNFTGRKTGTMDWSTEIEKSSGPATVTHASELIKSQLEQVERTLLNLPDIQPPDLRLAVEAIVSSGGKRIRPTITLLIAAMFANAEGRAINLASAVEMLHTATLVHDDLIDGSLMRRGATTLNAVWTPAATVLTGDFLFAVAAGMAARTDSLRVMKIFSETLGVIVAGELRQQFTDWAKRSTRDDYYKRIYAKTASMFVLAASAAGVVCDGTEEQVNALSAYGHDFGLAFQIVDDILDFTGEQANVGKPVGSDLRNGLITLPTICYIESHVSDAEIECALRGECDQATYSHMVTRIRESDAIDCALCEAVELVNSAKRSLALFPESPYRDALYDLADYTIERNK